jgi:hypothetical protein
VEVLGRREGFRLGRRAKKGVGLRDGVSVRRVGVQKGNCIRKSLLSTVSRVVEGVQWVGISSLHLGEAPKKAQKCHLSWKL